MKLIPLLVLGLGLLAAASGAGDAKPTEGNRPPNGIYGPDPKHQWLAGELMTISGNTFRYRYFTDALPGPPPCTGMIRIFPDHFVLDHPDAPNPERIAGVLNGVPVIWTKDAYEAWKKWGVVREIGVLYAREK
jgi:hypothetical protein